MDLVGNCRVCGKPVYCKGGFLDGVSENGGLYCHSCFEAEQSGEAGGQSVERSADTDKPGGESESV